MRRGRILHLIDTGGPGGAETICLELARGMEARGWNSVPVVPEIDWLDDAMRASGLDPVFLPNRRALDTTYVRSLRRLMQAESIDLVQAHLLGSGTYGAIACLGTGIPLVCTLHGRPDIDPEDRFRAVKTRLLRGAHHRVVCVSASLLDYFHRSGDLGANATVIENGVHLETFAAEGDGGLRSELGIDPDTPIFGAVGNVRPSKAYDVLLEAFARVRGAGAQALPHLAIAGHFDPEWPSYRQLHARAESLGILPRVHFLGFREDVPNLMRSFDIFVLSSSDEGFSLVTVQAMAAGLPCILTRSGGPEDIVGTSDAAELVPPGSPADMASAMDRLISDPGRCATLSRRARSRAMERFSVERMLDRYEDLYRMLLN